MSDRAYLEEWLEFLALNTKSNSDVTETRQNQLLNEWAERNNIQQKYKDKLEMQYINTLQEQEPEDVSPVNSDMGDEINHEVYKSKLNKELELLDMKVNNSKKIIEMIDQGIEVDENEKYAANVLGPDSNPNNYNIGHVIKEVERQQRVNAKMK